LLDQLTCSIMANARAASDKPPVASTRGIRAADAWGRDGSPSASSSGAKGPGGFAAPATSSADEDTSATTLTSVARAATAAPVPLPFLSLPWTNEAATVVVEVARASNDSRVTSPARTLVVRRTGSRPRMRISIVTVPVVAASGCRSGRIPRATPSRRTSAPGVPPRMSICPTCSATRAADSFKTDRFLMIHGSRSMPRACRMCSDAANHLPSACSARAIWARARGLCPLSYASSKRRSASASSP